MKDLRKFIKEEIKKLMQDDALFVDRDVPGIEMVKPKQNHKSSSYMAKPQLWHMAHQAADIYEMLDENEQIDDWAESHIAQASQMINSVYKSLTHKKRH